MIHLRNSVYTHIHINIYIYIYIFVCSWTPYGDITPLSTMSIQAQAVKTAWTGASGPKLLQIGWPPGAHMKGILIETGAKAALPSEGARGRREVAMSTWAHIFFLLNTDFSLSGGYFPIFLAFFTTNIYNSIWFVIDFD